MFKRKDYIDYFKQLYDVEIIMKKEVEDLLKIIEEPAAKELLERIRKDEMRHARIVKSMIKLI
jgi:hypothetical protein